jgi:hypothetical protein
MLGARLFVLQMLGFWIPSSSRSTTSSRLSIVPAVGLDDPRLPPECSSGPSPLLPDVHEDIVASTECLRDSFSDVVEGLGLAELFVEAPVDPEVADSTKLCDFLADLALIK